MTEDQKDEKAVNGVMGHASNRIVIIGGSILMLFGFIALGTELWRTWTGLNEIRVKYLTLAASILAFGFGIAQTGDALRIFRLAYEGYRFRKTMAPPGVGRRHYDPPPETAPPPVPREKWPKLPPRTARQQAADKESEAADRAAAEDR